MHQYIVLITVITSSLAVDLNNPQTFPFHDLLPLDKLENLYFQNRQSVDCSKIQKTINAIKLSFDQLKRTTALDDAKDLVGSILDSLQESFYELVERHGAINESLDVYSDLFDALYIVKDMILENGRPSCQDVADVLTDVINTHQEYLVTNEYRNDARKTSKYIKASTFGNELTRLFARKMRESS